jgi:tetratricopeptide (TPR) repeat protein
MLTVYSRNDEELSWEQYLEIFLHTLAGGAKLVKQGGKLTKTSALVEPAAGSVETVAEWAINVLGVHTKAKSARTLQRSFNRLIANSEAVDATLRDGFISMTSSVADLSSTVDEISAGLWAVEGTVRRGFSAVNSRLDDISDGLTHISAQVRQVSGEVEALRADFNWAMGALYWQMEAQQQQLKRILDVLQEPLDTQAKELRKRAVKAYERGLVSDPEWFGDALNDFLISAEKNRYDFLVHFYIADIYLYHQKPTELDKARKYFLNASRYAEFAEDRASYYSALALMYAGFVCYLQRDDEAAIEYSNRAAKLYPGLIEASYNHAKFAAAAGLAEVAIPSLERALRAERDYAVKVYLDEDFGCIEAQVSELVERLRAECRAEFAARLPAIEELVASGRVPRGGERTILDALLAEGKSLEGEGTYLSCRDALSRLTEVEAILEGLRIEERDRMLGTVRAQAARLREEISSHEIGTGLRSDVYGALDALDAFLATDLRYEEVGQALLAVNESRREWEAFVALGRARSSFRPGNTMPLSTAFSSDDATLILACDKDELRMWDVDRGEELESRQGVEVSHPPGLSPDGKTYFSSGYRSGFYNVRSGAKQANMEHDCYFHVAAFSPNGQRLVGSSANRLCLWDVKTGELKASAVWPYKKMLALAFSPDGHTVACAYRDGLMLWRVRSWQQGDQLLLWSVHKRRAIIAFSPDNGFLAAAEEGSSVKILKRVRRRGANIEEEHRGEDSGPALWLQHAQLEEPARAFAFGRDSRTLAVVSSGRVVLWDVESGEQRGVLNDYEGEATSLVFSHEGMTLAIGMDDGTVYLRDWVRRRSS